MRKRGWKTTYSPQPPSAPLCNFRPWFCLTLCFSATSGYWTVFFGTLLKLALVFWATSDWLATSLVERSQEAPNDAREKGFRKLEVGASHSPSPSTTTHDKQHAPFHHRTWTSHTTTGVLFSFFSACLPALCWLSRDERNNLCFCLLKLFHSSAFGKRYAKGAFRRSTHTGNRYARQLEGRGETTDTTGWRDLFFLRCRTPHLLHAHPVNFLCQETRDAYGWDKHIWPAWMPAQSWRSLICND